MSAINKIKELRKTYEDTRPVNDFKELFLFVLKDKGFSEEDIKEAEGMIRDAWPDKEARQCWINWLEDYQENVMGLRKERKAA